MKMRKIKVSLKSEDKVRAYINCYQKINPKWNDKEKEFGESILARNICTEFAHIAVTQQPERKVKEVLMEVLDKYKFPEETFRKYYNID